MSGVKTGTDVQIGDTVPRSFLAGDTGTAFVFGFSKRGPTDRAIPLTSLPHYVRECGERVAYGLVYDGLDVNFRHGLGLAYFVRLVGKDAKASSGKVKDGEGEGAKDTLEIVASSEGEWGDGVKWKVSDGTTPGTYRLSFTYEGDIETSPELESNADGVAWAATTRYARVKDLAGGNPVPSEGTLAGGDDDRESVNAETFAEARRLFPASLGPGQVAAFGFTSEAVHKVLLELCVETKRTPILDAEDTDDVEALLEDAAALRALPGARQAGLFAPWVTVPGPAIGTTRTLPMSVIMLGLIAAADRQKGHSNVAVAGPMGRASAYNKPRYAINVTQTYSEEEQAELNAAGVNVAIMDEGEVANYGYRTLANPLSAKPWLSLAASRLMTELAFGAKKVLKRSEFANLDAQGETRSKAEAAILLEVVQPLFEAKAIYGLSPAEACRVVVEQEVAPDDGTVGKLTGTLAAIPTGFAERIEFTVVNHPINEAL
jgi:hypothetical protein